MAPLFFYLHERRYSQSSTRQSFPGSSKNEKQLHST